MFSKSIFTALTISLCALSASAAPSQDELMQKDTSEVLGTATLPTDARQSFIFATCATATKNSMVQILVDEDILIGMQVGESAPATIVESSGGQNYFSWSPLTLTRKNKEAFQLTGRMQWLNPAIGTLVKKINLPLSKAEDSYASFGDWTVYTCRVTSNLF